MSQVRDGRCGRDHIHDISGQRDDGSGSKNRGTGRCDGLHACLFLRQRLSLCQVVVCQQDRVIDRSAQLDTADDDVTHVHHLDPLEIRHRHVDEDRHLNGNDDEDRHDSRLEAHHDDEEYARQGQNVYILIVLYDEGFDILGGRSLTDEIASLRVILLYDLLDRVGILECLGTLGLCPRVDQHPAVAAFM